MDYNEYGAEEMCRGAQLEAGVVASSHDEGVVFLLSRARGGPNVTVLAWRPLSYREVDDCGSHGAG